MCHFIRMKDIKATKRGRKFLRKGWWPFMRNHVVMVVGNWRSQGTRKGFKPTPQVEFYLRTFAERRLKCLIVDEYRTSRVCNPCLHATFDENARTFTNQNIDDLEHPDKQSKVEKVMKQLVNKRKKYAQRYRNN